MPQAQKSTISFEHLWHWANELAKAPTNKSSWVDLSQLHVALLNITPERKLQRETKDIIEELGIMLYISKKQKEVLKSFKRHASTLLDPEGFFRDGENLHVVMSDKVHEGREDKLIWNRFRAHAEEVLQEHEDHMEELEGLQRGAEHVNRNVSILVYYHSTYFDSDRKLCSARSSAHTQAAAGKRSSGVAGHSSWRRSCEAGKSHHDIHCHHDCLCKSDGILYMLAACLLIYCYSSHLPSWPPSSA